MNIITVIPIARGIGKENLTYFTSSEVQLGSLVQVPLRKKLIEGLVISIEDARSRKADLKTADFALKKVSSLVSKPFLSLPAMEAIKEIARYHACTTGAALKIFLTKKIIDELKAGKRKETETKTVVICPTKMQQRIIKEKTKKEKDALVLLPSSLLDIPRSASRIIIENDGSRAYKGISRPFIDFRYAFKIYAEKAGIKISYEDSLARIENIKLPIKSRKPAVERIISDLKRKENEKFNIIGDDLRKSLLSIKHSPAEIFILSTRKGHSGVLVCQDCGQAVLCTRCQAPLTLHLSKKEGEYNNLLCHHCGHRETALKKCLTCGGWRLKAFGIGVEKAEEEVNAFLKKNGISNDSVAVGTEASLLPLMLHRKEKISTFCVISLDSMLSLPDFSINERIMRLLLNVEEQVSGKMIVQTKNIKHPLLLEWQKNDLNAFYEREIAERKALGYPPFNVFIKLSVKGEKEKVAAEMKKITTLLSEWKLSVFPAFIKTQNNQHILHALISVKKEYWEDPARSEELSVLLLSLPPSVTINVNPESML